jgi:MFS transporter, NNP family, nitrate/nitrite transporter
MSQANSHQIQAQHNLCLATLGFAVSFACWGIIAGLAPLLKKELGLSVTQSSIMVAIPILLGAIGRLPMGILTDRYGGRVMLTILLIFAFFPALALSINYSYLSLLFWGLLLGLAGSSFAIGIGFVSKWFPPEKQGIALGIYGTGNMGQSLAVFGGPILGNAIGISQTFLVFGLASLAWGVVVWQFARNAQKPSQTRTFADNIEVLRTERLSWVLSFFYSLTFGGFVALSMYLPTLYQVNFNLDPVQAGGFTALFVLLATFSRPLGGWLGDRFGGEQLLLFIFGGIFLLGWTLALPSIWLFNLGVFACALLLGVGNGGVFKLVPQYFPENTGTVTGLVGASGGLGGFFPPILLGLFKDNLGTYTPSFILFSLFGLACALLLNRTFLHTIRHHKHAHE